MPLPVFLLLLLAVLWVLYVVVNYIQQLNHWRKRNVKYLTPLPIVGNLLPTISKSISGSEYVVDLYNRFPKERYCGIYQFQTPILLIRDPELIKTITIKEFTSFQDHAANLNTDLDPLWSKSLFASYGTKWRTLRQTLSPVFTSKKMKIMYVLMEDYTNRFINYINSQEENIVEVELITLIKKFSMDVIATTAFGIETNAMEENENDNDFYKMGAELTDFSGLRRLRFLLYNSRFLAKLPNMKMVSDRVGNYFHSIIKQAIDARTKANIVRPDLIHLLMEARKGKLQENTTESPNKKVINLTDLDITAQAIVFLVGGYDTTARLIAFCLYELAANPKVQERLTQEVDVNYQKFGSKIEYEDLFKMKYLDMVILETLRKWPVAPFLDRKTVAPFTIQPEGEGESALHLQVGDIIWFPVFGIHRDPKYWPNPETFDPERFSDENNDKILPGTFLSFGIGPRNCIGSRYATMVAKLLVFHILANFEVVPTGKSTIPLEISKNHIILHPKDDLWFGFKKRQETKKTI